MHDGFLCHFTIFVYIFRGNVDAAVVPFEGIGDGERLKAVSLAEGSKDWVAGNDIGEVECAALSVVESDFQRVARKIFCVCDFQKHSFQYLGLFKWFYGFRVFAAGGLLPGRHQFVAVQVEPLQYQPQSTLRHFAFSLAVCKSTHFLSFDHN